MKVPAKYYDEIFNFRGQWDMPSSCGLKIINENNSTYMIVTELYQDNPGTSVTYAGYSLAKQICDNKSLSINEIFYIECNPDTDSKLSFYDEEFFEVTFPESRGESGKAKYRQLSSEEIKNIFCNAI
ncbi:MAG: hypothetical protein LBT24_02370 [Tannerella sp.]|jgi:hypothetical protein|nr:hypothetical protein [Tannerella sp.]